MLFSLVWTALIMGLVGGPHCLVMCAAPCSVVTAAKPVGGGQPVAVHGLQKRQWLRTSLFHLGRIAAYALLGGIAAMAMESLAWVTSQTTALQRLWMLMHVAVMAWGLAMVVQARQPAWLERAGRSVWARVQPWVTAPGGSLAAGFAWALMPCGLLYSAVLVAALSGGAWQGALSMAAFAVGGALWLLAGPWLWQLGQSHVNALRARWGTRVAGLMLIGVASWALWMDLVYKPGLWCR
ncbi:sulfite exporter TauE/SafE family protein [Comamonas testosteroni]|uniref:sulfite exporter TauE/SafE family protein n=1 Tax=Comamonas testosteroni TaxID=285 RepID=UPI00265F0D73|nr:sulfite exporter TauE/SafE family protein [Comamonas testosteroni]WKL16398.1 sulfite exporter TauE/SafE family protein [Comamonas testosteroni]